MKTLLTIIFILFSITALTQESGNVLYEIETEDINFDRIIVSDFDGFSLKLSSSQYSFNNDYLNWKIVKSKQEFHHYEEIEEKVFVFLEDGSTIEDENIPDIFGVIACNNDLNNMYVIVILAKKKKNNDYKIKVWILKEKLKLLEN